MDVAEEWTPEQGIQHEVGDVQGVQNVMDQVLRDVMFQVGDVVDTLQVVLMLSGKWWMVG